MWAARVPWTAAARYAAGACAASLAAPPPTDCDAVRRRLTPIGRFALLSETRDAPSVPAVPRPSERATGGEKRRTV